MSEWIRALATGTQLWHARPYTGPAAGRILPSQTPEAPRSAAIGTGMLPPALTTGPIRTGAGVTTVDQLRDQFLDVQFRREHNGLGHCESRMHLLQQLEASIREPHGPTIGDRLSGFWESWRQLVREPTRASREAIRTQAAGLVDAFRAASGRLQALEAGIDSALNAQTEQLNVLGRNIANLNGRIAAGGSDGTLAADARVQRNLLVDRLARLADVRVEADPVGATVVHIDGREFVRGGTVREMAFRQVGPGAGARAELVWRDTEQPVPFKAGQIRALLEARDLWLPEARAALDQLAGALVAEVNTRHPHGGTPDGHSGIPFFEPSYVTADSIQLHAFVADTSQWNHVAGPTGSRSDAATAQAMADLADTPVMPDGGTTLNDYWDALVTTMGMRSTEATDMTETQRLLVGQLSRQRESVTGASLHEGLVQMIKSQHAYEAAARVMNTMDEALGKVSQGMGNAGR